MRAVRWLAMAIALAWCVANDAQASGFTIDDWTLGIGVTEEGAGSAGTAFLDPMNPFVTSHWAGVNSSLAIVSYDLAWWEANGRFIVQSTQDLSAVPGSYVSMGSKGDIRVTPYEDMPLALDASWTYNLPVDRMETQVRLSVGQADGSTMLFDEEYVVASSPGEPASGTLAFDGQVTLPAGQTWVLHYEMCLFTYAGTQYNYATGNGYVNFQLTPEPVTLVLLVLVSLLARRRRSQRHRRES